MVMLWRASEKMLDAYTARVKEEPAAEVQSEIERLQVQQRDIEKIVKVLGRLMWPPEKVVGELKAMRLQSDAMKNYGSAFHFVKGYVKNRATFDTWFNTYGGTE